MRRQPRADLGEPRLAGPAVVGGGLHLDELVGGERALDFRDDLVGEALVADHHDGLQRVGVAAQFTAARGSQGSGHGPIIGER